MSCELTQIRASKLVANQRGFVSLISLVFVVITLGPQNLILNENSFVRQEKIDRVEKELEINCCSIKMRVIFA